MGSKMGSKMGEKRVWRKGVKMGEKRVGGWDRTIGAGELIS